MSFFFLQYLSPESTIGAPPVHEHHLEYTSYVISYSFEAVVCFLFLLLFFLFLLVVRLHT